MEDDNEKYFPSAFLYIITDYDEYFTKIIDEQKNDYWKIKDSSYHQFYDTAPDPRLFCHPERNEGRRHALTIRVRETWTIGEADAYTPEREEYYIRMNIHERIQHHLVWSSFVILAITGFMVEFPEGFARASIPLSDYFCVRAVRGSTSSQSFTKLDADGNVIPDYY